MTTRRILDDGTWFDPANASRWRKDDLFQRTTGKRAMQSMWRTKQGAYVLESWLETPQLAGEEGDEPRYFLNGRHKVDIAEAAAWFIRNEIPDPPGEILTFLEGKEI